MTIKLSELEALEKAATKGPWEWSGRKVDEDGHVYIPQCSALGGTLIHLADTYEGSAEDCDLIAAARNALPELLAFVRKARKLLTDYTFPCAAEYLGEYLKVLDGEAKKLLETIED